ncbi:MAG: prenyltransferase [Deltaproteobacteria bacterium]|nr:prenyltransferase [Deltaproteobacteria bacterium]
MTVDAKRLDALDFRDALRGAASRIVSIQCADGAIPWYEDGPWDPWNHTECAMALAVVGEASAARRGFEHLAERQKADGSWLAEYGNAVPMEDERHMSRGPAPTCHDTNFTAYCAVGVRHAALLWADERFAAAYWPMVVRAIDFVLRHQSVHGDISWSAEAAAKSGADDALLAGNASIYKSLQCAIDLGRQLGEDVERWALAREKLGEAIRTKPHRFGRQREERSAFAMDWYYPILSGALDGRGAAWRLHADWDRFVEPGRGCRCVAHEPWVTVAETSELVMTLISVGRRAQALALFESQARHTDAGGAYWMGWQFKERIFWPEETPSWTQAAVILAADALYGDTPASRLLTDQGSSTRRKIRRVSTDSTSRNSSERSAS